MESKYYERGILYMNEKSNLSPNIKETIDGYNHYEAIAKILIKGETLRLDKKYRGNKKILEKLLIYEINISEYISIMLQLSIDYMGISNVLWSNMMLAPKTEKELRSIIDFVQEIIIPYY